MDYEVENEKNYFEMRLNQLIVKKNLEPSEFDIQIRAKLYNYFADVNSDQNSEPEYVQVSHQMHVIIMKNRDKYPVFERIEYEIQVNLKNKFLFFKMFFFTLLYTITLN